MFTTKIQKIGLVIPVLALVYLGVSTFSVFATSFVWVTKADMPTVRYGVAAATGVNGKIYAIGGGNTDGFTEPVEEYDPSADVWTTKSNMPTPRWSPGMVAANDGKMYVIGGLTSSSLATVEAYDPLADTWTIRASMPTPRQSLGVVQGSNGKLYAIGGTTETTVSLPRNIVEEYDLDTNTWISRTHMPTARGGLAVVAANNGKIYALGGFTEADPVIATGTVEEYDPATDLWTTKASMPTARYHFASVLGNNGKIYVIGGADTSGQSLGSVEEYDPELNTWSVVQGIAIPRYALGATVGSSGKIYAIGGYRSGETPPLSNKVEEATVIINQAPSVDAGGPYSVYEGSSVAVTAVGNDPENSTLSYAWDLDGNGSFEASGQSVNVSAEILNGPSSKVITAQVTDNGGLSSTDEATVNILNVAPAVGVVTASVSGPVPINTQVSASASFSDPGKLDTHTAVWNWGDGATSTGTVSESNGSGTVSNSHIYTTPGVYTVTLRVTDDAGAEQSSIFRYVVVYNPNDSFITGGGHYTSQEGWYLPEEDAAGKMIIGIHAKYSHGGTIPTGKTRLHFKVGNFEFNSTSYQWLVVNGETARLQGNGTVNGSEGYTFLVSVIDGGPAGEDDWVRFQIRDISNAVMYDTQAGDAEDALPVTPLDSGSIQIH